MPQETPRNLIIRKLVTQARLSPPKDKAAFKRAASEFFDATTHPVIITELDRIAALPLRNMPFSRIVSQAWNQFLSELTFQTFGVK